MLSVILYGRNDDHGYNYHKRIAVSLNCIAAILSEPNDEIVFVDYNTPNDLPTIIEAVADTLTLKAKSLLRTLRVRPSQHARFAGQSHLPLLEPVARNVAIRRTRPDNRWILSTSIDMIFVTENREDTLTNIFANLKDGFYCLPRMEIPETLWELALERSSPEKNIAFLRENSRKLHLNTVVRRNGFLKYDNPGDFQLMLRKDLMEIGGFNEQMVSGWHVDANLSKRLFLHHNSKAAPNLDIPNGNKPPLENLLRCYHCNHTQKESFLHSKHRTENSWYRFVSNPSLSPILTQENWGLANESIEEFSLTSSRINTHVNAVIAALNEEQSADYDLLINLESYNHLLYCPSRVFTYLTDHLCNLPEDANLIYIGYNMSFIHLLNAYLAESKKKLFCLKHYVDKATAALQTVVLSDSITTLPQGSVFIFDFGIDENSLLGKMVFQSTEGYQIGRGKIKKVMQDFFKIVKKSNQIHQNSKFVGIHLRHSDFDFIFSKHLSIYLNSHITGIAYGCLLQKKPRRRANFLSILQKRQILMHCGYYVTRYLFSYSDRIRRFVSKLIAP